MSWQPIETYPHVPSDCGPDVLLYVPNRSARTDELFHGGYQCVGHSNWFCYDPDEPEWTPTFYDGDWDVKPTYWQPLPEPPK